MVGSFSSRVASILIVSLMVLSSLAGLSQGEDRTFIKLSGFVYAGGQPAPDLNVSFTGDEATFTVTTDTLGFYTVMIPDDMLGETGTLAIVNDPTSSVTLSLESMIIHADLSVAPETSPAIDYNIPEIDVIPSNPGIPGIQTADLSINSSVDIDTVLQGEVVTVSYKVVSTIDHSYAAEVSLYWGVIHIDNLVGSFIYTDLPIASGNQLSFDTSAVVGGVDLISVLSVTGVEDVDLSNNQILNRIEVISTDITPDAVVDSVDQLQDDLDGVSAPRSLSATLNLASHKIQSASLSFENGDYRKSVSEYNQADDRVWLVTSMASDDFHKDRISAALFDSILIELQVISNEIVRLSHFSSGYQTLEYLDAAVGINELLAFTYQIQMENCCVWADVISILEEARASFSLVRLDFVKGLDTYKIPGGDGFMALDVADTTVNDLFSDELITLSEQEGYLTLSKPIIDKGLFDVSVEMNSIAISPSEYDTGAFPQPSTNMDLIITVDNTGTKFANNVIVDVTDTTTSLLVGSSVFNIPPGQSLQQTFIWSIPPGSTQRHFLEIEANPSGGGHIPERFLENNIATRYIQVINMVDDCQILLGTSIASASEFNQGKDCAIVQGGIQNPNGWNHNGLLQPTKTLYFLQESSAAEELKFDTEFLMKQVTYISIVQGTFTWAPQGNGWTHIFDEASVIGMADGPIIDSPNSLAMWNVNSFTLSSGNGLTFAVVGTACGGSVSDIIATDNGVITYTPLFGAGNWRLQTDRIGSGLYLNGDTCWSGGNFVPGGTYSGNALAGVHMVNVASALFLFGTSSITGNAYGIYLDNSGMSLIGDGTSVITSNTLDQIRAVSSNIAISDFADIGTGQIGLHSSGGSVTLDTTTFFQNDVAGVLIECSGPADSIDITTGWFNGNTNGLIVDGGNTGCGTITMDDNRANLNVEKGMAFHEVSNVVIENSQIINDKVGLSFVGGSGNLISGTVTPNQIVGNELGVQLLAESSSGIVDQVIEGSIALGDVGVEIIVSDGTTATFTTTREVDIAFFVGGSPNTVFRGGTIEDTVIQGIMTELGSGGELLVTDSMIIRATETGVYCSGSSMSKCEIANNVQFYDQTDFGVVAISGQGISITDSVFDNQFNAILLITDAGSVISNGIISRNTLNDVENGIVLNAINGGNVNQNTISSNTITLKQVIGATGIILLEGGPLDVSDLNNDPNDEVNDNIIEGNTISLISTAVGAETGIFIAGGTGNIIRDDAGTPNQIQVLTQGGIGLPEEGGGIVLVRADDTKIRNADIQVTSPGIVMIATSSTGITPDIQDVTITSVGIGMMMFGSEDIELVDVDITASQIGLFIQANFLHTGGLPVDPIDYPSSISLEGLQIHGSPTIGVLTIGIAMECRAGMAMTNDISIKASLQDTLIKASRGIKMDDCRGVTIDDTQIQPPVLALSGTSGIELLASDSIDIGLTGPVAIFKDAGAPNGFATGMTIGGSTAVVIEDVTATDIRTIGMAIVAGSEDVTVRRTSIAGTGLGFSTGLLIISSQDILFEGQDSPPLLSGFGRNVGATNSGTSQFPIVIESSTLGSPIGVIDLDVGATAYVDTLDTVVNDKTAHLASGGGLLRVRWYRGVSVTSGGLPEVGASVVILQINPTEPIEIEDWCNGGLGSTDLLGNCDLAKLTEFQQSSTHALRTDRTPHDFFASKGIESGDNLGIMTNIKNLPRVPIAIS